MSLCETSASSWFLSSFFFLLKFHLFLPSPSDRITSPLVTLCSFSHTHTQKLFSMVASLPLTQTSSLPAESFSLHPTLSAADPPPLYTSVCSTHGTVHIPPYAPKRSFSPAFISTSYLPPPLPTFSLPLPFSSPTHYCVQIF